MNKRIKKKIFNLKNKKHLICIYDLPIPYHAKTVLSSKLNITMNKLIAISYLRTEKNYYNVMGYYEVEYTYDSVPIIESKRKFMKFDVVIDYVV